MEWIFDCFKRLLVILIKDFLQIYWLHYYFDLRCLERRLCIFFCVLFIQLCTVSTMCWSEIWSLFYGFEPTLNTRLVLEAANRLPISSLELTLHYWFLYLTKMRFWIFWKIGWVSVIHSAVCLIIAEIENWISWDNVLPTCSYLPSIDIFNQHP